MSTEAKEKIDEMISKYTKAANIFMEIEPILTQIVVKRAKILDIAEKIEDEIIKRGGKPAFPVNIAIGDIAAHYTPNPEEKTVIPEDKIIKIDIGVHVDGYICDAARSFYFGGDDEKKRMIEVAKNAVDKAISMLKAGVDLAEIGGAIEDLVKEAGFKVVRNLHGHKLEKWVVHGDKEFPVVAGAERTIAEENEVYAIEVFVTNGDGEVRTTDDIRIYSLISLEKLPRRIPLHVKVARQVFRWIQKERRTLPFSLRWVAKVFGIGSAKLALASLTRLGLLLVYPVLKETKEGSDIAQWEETVLVTKNGAKVLSRKIEG